MNADALVQALSDGARLRVLVLLASLFGLLPFLRKLYADGGYQGPVFRKADV